MNVVISLRGDRPIFTFYAQGQRVGTLLPFPDDAVELKAALRQGGLEVIDLRSEPSVAPEPV